MIENFLVFPHQDQPDSHSENLVSIVIVNYNCRAHIVGCISSVLKTKYPNFEIIVVDNASTDDSLDLIRRAFTGEKKVKILASTTNLGYAAGNNLGIRFSRGEFVALLNPDTTVDPNWIGQLLRYLSEDEVGAVQPKLLLTNQKNCIDSVGHYVDRCGVESLWSTKVTGELDHGQYDFAREIFYAKGAAILLKRAVLAEVGLLDPDYFSDHEEIDLCWRIHLAGYKILYVPDSIVHHARAGPSWRLRSENSPFLLFHLRKNHLSSLVKNYESRNLIRYGLVYVLFLLLHGVYRLSRHDTSVISAHLRAILWVLRRLPSILERRYWIQGRIRKVPDREVMRLMTQLTIPFHFL